MPSIHEVLRWANRTLVAEEVTRRGYRVSGETMNRWYRNRSEVPAIVEHIVFELFKVSGHNETPPPWAEALQTKVDEIYARQEQVAAEAVKQVVEVLAPADIRAAANRVIARLEALPPQPGEDPAGSVEGEVPGGAAPPGRGRE